MQRARELTSLEQRVLTCASCGMARDETMELLNLTEKQLKNITASARRALRTNNTTHSVAKAIRLGLIT